MKFLVPEKYDDQLLEFAGAMLNDLSAQGRMDFSGIDYLVTSRQVNDFGKRTAFAANLNGQMQIVVLSGQYGDAHTSALPLHYQELAGSGLLEKNQSVLFVSADSGLSAACCLYRV